MPPPRLILVEPGIPANLGFVARLVANFGLHEWVAVGGCPVEGTEAERTGAPARPALAALRRVTRFEEAMEGCSHLLAFTARAGRHRRPRPLPEIGPLLSEWGPEARVGLVFGPEDRGLENSLTERCDALFRIPTAGLSSLNLSHAVAIVLYEYHREERPAAPAGPEWADARDRQRLVEKTRRALRAAGYPDRVGDLEDSLRRLAANPIEARDLRTLERILRHVRWRREGA